MLVSYRKRPDNVTIELAEVNGLLSLLYKLEGRVVGVMSVQGSNGQITNLWAVLNPDKLRHLQ